MYLNVRAKIEPDNISSAMRYLAEEDGAESQYPIAIEFFKSIIRYLDVQQLNQFKKEAIEILKKSMEILGDKKLRRYV